MALARLASLETFQPTRHPLIAVQVMEDEGCVRAQDGRPLEAVITEKLRHPALVAALGHAAAPGTDARDRGEKTWLLLEFCDCGSLIVRPARRAGQYLCGLQDTICVASLCVNSANTTRMHAEHVCPPPEASHRAGVQGAAHSKLVHWWLSSCCPGMRSQSEPRAASARSRQASDGTAYVRISWTQWRPRCQHMYVRTRTPWSVAGSPRSAR